MASFLILLHSSAYANQSSRSALKYAQAVINKGHELKAVFFYSEAVYHANSLAIIPTDEDNIGDGFRQLNKTHNTPLLLCVTAAEKRGIIDAQQAKLELFDHHNLDESFTIAGLAEMAEIACECDRLVQFR